MSAAMPAVLIPRTLPLLCGIAVAVLVTACGQGPRPDDLVEGRYFPDLVLQDFEGGTARLSEFRGKLVVFNVWATWCPPCRKEMPALERLQATLGAEDYAVLGLSVDSDADIALEFLLERGITFRNYFDRDGRNARGLLGIRAYPDTFIISPDGVLLKGVVGDRAWDDPAVVAALVAARGGDRSALGGI